MLSRPFSVRSSHAQPIWEQTQSLSAWLPPCFHRTKSAPSSTCAMNTTSRGRIWIRTRRARTRAVSLSPSSWPRPKVTPMRINASLISSQTQLTKVSIALSESRTWFSSVTFLAKVQTQMSSAVCTIKITFRNAYTDYSLRWRWTVQLTLPTKRPKLVNPLLPKSQRQLFRRKPYIWQRIRSWATLRILLSQSRSALNN
jgi:hypothetical protein